ncbi:MAG: NAD-binding protein, partial [Thermoanaerobaculia bacterium]
IGMLLHPTFVLTHLALVLGLVAAVVVTKIVAAYPAFRAGSSLPRTSIRAAFAVAPIGEFSFLLAQEGKRHGVMSVNDEQALIAVAVITLASTPLLLSAGSALAGRLRGGRERGDETRESKLKNHIIIVGYGLNGRNVARVLTATSVRHIILEEDRGRAEVARGDGGAVIVADAADPDALDSANISDALAVVIAISDPDGTRRIVRACRAQSPTVHILVRTRYVSEVEFLRALGANEIIPEEFETSIEIVTRLMRVLGVPGNLVAAQLRLLRDEGYKMLRDPALRTAEGRRLSAVLAAGTAQTFLVLPDTAAEGRTLDELRIADDHLAVPAIIRDGVPMPSPSGDERLRSGDMLFLVGAHEDLIRVTDRLEQSVTAPGSLPG